MATRHLKSDFPGFIVIILLRDLSPQASYCMLYFSFFPTQKKIYIVDIYIIFLIFNFIFEGILVFIQLYS